ncbi:MAG: DEAD/DEAH box helicase family protein [bacterium]|nr:DEAD/DEAH box helicase family protein [bacterium]
MLEWRENNYQSDYTTISEILEFNLDPESGNLRFLRKAQFEALETYWYLRLVERTPHIYDLYKKLFQPRDLLKSLGINLTQDDLTEILLNGGGVDSIFEKIKINDNFVKKYRLDALRETLLLNYPSYILALAMGAGKTILIGTIIATEFAMALEYPEDPESSSGQSFVKNALVFAPGKTILGALKELSDIPFEKILPLRLYKEFITSVKFTYTRDGEKDIPIIKESSFNIVVTNTEKIRIQKQTITKTLIKDLYANTSQEDMIKQEVANRRLQTIASLPNLAIFSDEAHHTYGMKLGEELKRVRQTVDYLAENTNLLIVINTTGTPYFERQILKDVIYWYGLSQGIKDGILKEVRGNIVAYPEVEDEQFIRDIIADFFRNYKDVKIYDGTPSKLALYFPNIANLQDAKPVVETALIEIGEDPSIVLEVHNESKDEIKDLFDNRINDRYLPYRVFLLVNKGTEGWNCLSLYATALARELKASNNFCLQAASRCLRQTPRNIHKAKIYLSQHNVKILDSQLKETYGETLQELNLASPDLRKERLILRKTEIPPLLLKKKIFKLIPLDKKVDFENIEIHKPEISTEESKITIYDLKDIPDRKGVLITQKEEKFIIIEDFVDAYSFAVELSSLYRLPLMRAYEKIKSLYPDGEILESHAFKIRKQLEEKLKNYEITQEEIEIALALIKLNNFNKEERNGKAIYTTEIIYHKDKEKLLLKYEGFKEQYRGCYQLEFGFHYSPYNFDSNPEKDFFEQLLVMLNENPADVEDIYYTGAISDPNKTDFIFEYKGKDDRWHNYTPDFLIKRKNGKMNIVEIKAEIFIDKAKEKALKEIEGLNPDKLKYEILITDKDEIGFENISKVREAIYEYGGKNA